MSDSVTLLANGWGMPPLPDAVANSLLEAVLTGQETLQLETKRVSGKMVGKALQTICAFANSHGGWLMLGVEDFDKGTGRDRLYGIQENPEAIDELLRKMRTQFAPSITGLKSWMLWTELRDGKQDQLIVIQVPPSDKVHSIIDGGTWLRLPASNREMNASEITELSYRRGVHSAESEPVDVDFDLLDTATWRLFMQGRGLSSTGLADQLYRIGLAKKSNGVLKPLRAAVLLFADYPGALLAASGTRADVRVFHYKGIVDQAGDVPNLKKPPKTFSGPIYQLISQVDAYVLDELAQGLTLAASGFDTVHRYPARVVKEAITNALIHRDYHLNRDVIIRIFDNRLEVISPGLFAGRITAATVQKMGSFARNPLIASNLREFPVPPNVDAGEGVRMMFSLMRDGNLYPPQYREQRDQAQEAIVVTLLNEERPPVWEQVSDWMDRNGPISNNELCKIANLDTLKASRQLQRWVLQGLLISDDTRGKRNTVYRKPSQVETDLLHQQLPSKDDA
ncbi:ATP-binding protein [Oxalicibacterium faecigallinarum]|uniref:DNA-binding protein n=1 Tax=Oxalicibacterium faecigallinarum TaxID=573741 RepID=A0A8J3ARY1_9BURK|nr:ATP-binding protein [Oxalicibacterium faecigallinarum]GGI19968.1 DNA-binding protein [Oxalicibacterium faecigallinarum]